MTILVLSLLRFNEMTSELTSSKYFELIVNWFLSLLVRNVIEREIERERVQMKPPYVCMIFSKEVFSKDLKRTLKKSKENLVERKFSWNKISAKQNLLERNFLERYQIKIFSKRKSSWKKIFSKENLHKKDFVKRKSSRKKIFAK